MNNSRSTPKLAAAAVSVALALGLSACSAADSAPPTKPGPPPVTATHTPRAGRISGSLIMEGGASADAGPRPIRGTIDLSPGRGKSISIDVGNSGTFSSSVPVGTYTVVGHTPMIHGPGGVEGYCPTKSPTIITAGDTTSITVACIVP